MNTLIVSVGKARKLRETKVDPYFLTLLSSGLFEYPTTKAKRPKINKVWFLDLLTFNGHLAAAPTQFIGAY